jgi:integrase
MTLRQRGAKWEARYRDLDGKERTQSFRLKADATTWLTEQQRMVRMVRAGLMPDPRLVEPEPVRPQAGSVVDAVTEWLGTKQSLSPRTRKDYEALRDSLIKPTFEEVPVRDLTPAQISGWIEGMYGRGLSQSRVKQGWVVLSQTLKWCWAGKVIEADPAREALALWPSMLKPPRSGSRRAKAVDRLTPEQVETLAQELGEHALMIRMLALTGLRWGELSALQVKHIDLLTGRVLVQQAFTKTGDTGTKDRGLTLVPPKSGQPREVPLVSALRKPLEALVAALGSPDAYLFTRAKDGLPWTYMDFYSGQFRPAVLRLGWDVVGLHDLRRFFASQHASRGVPPIVLAKLLGHADAGRLALNTYADAYASDVSDAMAGLEDAMKGRISS